MLRVRPVPVLEGLTSYRVPRPPIPVDLPLDANEGQAPSDAVLGVLRDLPADRVRRYPSTAALRRLAADAFGVEPENVLVTAGADDALERALRAVVRPGDRVVVPEPSFSMIAPYVALVGGQRVSIPWSAPEYPEAAVLDAVAAGAAAVLVVSPNNPAGGTATRAQVVRIAAAAPEALVIVDHAYVEFGGADLTRLPLEQPNVVVLRTLSKAWGLAGLRVGFAVADPRVIAWLEAVGHPYAVSGPSLAVAEAALRQGPAAVRRRAAQVQTERAALEALLREAGLRVQPSAGNFAFFRTEDPLWVRDALAGLGIGVRAFPGDPQLGDAVRITCPGDPEAFDRLRAALETLFFPEALLFDVDGVLVDVRESYRRAILETAAHFGVSVSPADVAAEKQRGEAANDWVVTQRLCEARGVAVGFEAVKAEFEARYQGTPERPGLREVERLLVSRELLARLATRLRLGLVTGRPRADLERALDRFGLRGLFGASVVMEDAPAKPDPEPVRRALERLGVRRAWMVGDTVDDARAARGARVLPLAACWMEPSDEVLRQALHEAGAARVLPAPEALLALVEALPRPTGSYGAQREDDR